MNRSNPEILNRHSGWLKRAIICVWLLALGFSSAQAGEQNSKQQINLAIEHYINELLQSRYQKIGLHIQPVDDRLKLARCELPLKIRHRPANRISGRLTMKVSCDAQESWRIHVPVQVKAFDNVVLAKHPIPKDTSLTELDIKIELRDITLLHGGYYKDASQVIGLISKRPVSENQILSANSLQPAMMVERGESVVILAEGNGLSIRTTGVAMQKGAYGELIRVRNSKTNKIVEGRITAPGQIKVSL